MFQEMSFPSPICLHPENLFFSQNDFSFSNFVWGKFPGKFKFRVKKFNFKLRKIGPTGVGVFMNSNLKGSISGNLIKSTLFDNLHYFAN